MWLPASSPGYAHRADDRRPDRDSRATAPRPLPVGAGFHRLLALGQLQPELAASRERRASRSRSIGSSPTTAIVAACSRSATSAPVNVAPTTTSRARSVTSWALPAHCARRSSPRSYRSWDATRTTVSMPASTDCCAVTPTAVTCGLAKTTRGAPSSPGGAQRAAGGHVGQHTRLVLAHVGEQGPSVRRPGRTASHAREPAGGRRSPGTPRLRPTGQCRRSTAGGPPPPGARRPSGAQDWTGIGGSMISSTWKRSPSERSTMRSFKPSRPRSRRTAAVP